MPNLRIMPIGTKTRARPLPVWALVVGAAALLTTPATAQQAEFATAGPWQVSAFGGWYTGSRPYVFHGAVTDNVKFESAPVFGLRVGHDINSTLGLELSWTQAHPDQSFVTLVPSYIRTIVMNNYEADLDVYFGRGSVRGFVIFGVGGSSTGSTFGGTNFTGTVGLGLEIFVDRHFAIRVDARANDSYGNLGKYGAPAFCDPAGCYFYKPSWYPSGTATAGLTYAF
ncbi:MAG TPA: outer membrane beta-barrel protein [Thermoanaerobaculia bacterium]|nr:outer membrane beta-barrel protein [Thermoanaerobaculia bacterium]